MAKPAFIYAFDNLGDERFVELCGALLASRYRGFLLGGVGADGGIDGTIDQVLGEWRPEGDALLLNEIVEPGTTVIFQFKHIVTARSGQSNARSSLLTQYRCTQNRTCELHKPLVTTKNPSVYVLVTNVEVNSNFRELFIAQCHQEQPHIRHFQVIGLDELEAWVNSQPQIGYLYFPTIFGLPRFDLRIVLGEVSAAYTYGDHLGEFVNLFQITIRNTGLVPSYIQNVWIRVLVDGKDEFCTFQHINPDPMLEKLNPIRGGALEPGRSETHSVYFSDLAQLGYYGKEVIPVEVHILDEIGNRYSEIIQENLRKKMLNHMYPSKK
jgi:hypothetical protein